MRQDVAIDTVELTSLRQNSDIPSSVENDDRDDTATRRRDRCCGGIWGAGGWKTTLYLGSITSFTVLILNLVMVCWANFRHSDEGHSILYSGDCDKAKEIGTGVHVLVNALSTLLLSASNFTMQCLSAPTRRDVDNAHAGDKWLDIGVPSVRNLWRIPRLRLVFWLCLALTSVPIHMFYNSTVYSTIAVNAYDVYLANSSFTLLTEADVQSVWNKRTKEVERIPSASRLVRMSAALEKLSPEECISAYKTSFQSKYASVVLISDTFSSLNTSIIRIYNVAVPTPQGDDTPYTWECEEEWVMGPLAFDSCTINPENWMVDFHKVDYCLAERTPEKCTLQYSLPLAVVVICVNLVKAVIICIAPIFLRVNPLLTIGDGIGSFLRWPNKKTGDNCLLTREAENNPNPPRYNAIPKRRWSSLSMTRWIVCLSTYVVSIAICIGLLLFGVAHIDNPSEAWTAGLAAVSTQTMIQSPNWPTGLIPNVLIANAPQLIYSGLYFMTNSILTNMALASEWTNLSLHRKGLRVSTKPVGAQRRTRFLSLPFRIGIPLMVISGVLHWLMSQSLFLVRLLAYSETLERQLSEDTMTLGWSAPAIVSCICVGSLLPIGLLVLGSRRLRSGMPLAGSCSLAISAACHPRLKMEDTHGMGIQYSKLKWGVEAYQEDEVWHCAFSDGRVMEPVHETVYR
ncbi:hypothetical protein BDW74DRAFT_189275 [Aspergillus multicolor]|uniref:uncharacterized protein n=1 Tax=Aspergillus multicolor TaxID=41759 RepID=UPI003CCCFBB0